MENPNHAFSDTNLVLPLIEQLRIKNKTLMTWSSPKIKESNFYNAYFALKKFM